MPEDRAAGIGNMHKNLVKIVWFRRYPRGQTDILITILRNRFPRAK